MMWFSFNRDKRTSASPNGCPIPRRLAVWFLAFLSVAFLGSLVSASISAIADAATLPAGFSESLVTDAVAFPTRMQFAPDGRLFICERGGNLRIIKNGALLPTPFLSLQVSTDGERGLLGVTFDPNFATNHFLYLYYSTQASPIHNRLSRFTANGDVVLAGSEVVLLELPALGASVNIHNAGDLHFGADGKLYVAVGNHGLGLESQSVTNLFQQNSNLLGKLLRLDPANLDLSNLPDSLVPADNPSSFTVVNSQGQTLNVTTTGVNRAIWALGLRNPFSFAIQPGTGTIFINDVGEINWEEINRGSAGANYGWPITEGYTTDSRFKSPLFAYAHGAEPTKGCAITGGAFYNPVTNQFPAEYVGTYLFTDYCNGWIHRYSPTTNTVADFASGIDSPVNLLVGDDGSLYYASLNGNAIYRIQHSAAGGQAPVIAQQPADQTVTVGGQATFSVSASGTGPFSYQWQRNNANIAGATSSIYSFSPVATSDNGATFRCLVSNSAGTTPSRAATLTVTSNQPPVGTITAPGVGALYSAGETISYAGTGTDPEDGTLPPSAFTWEVVFHHDTHTHPFIAPFSGVKNGTFVIPDVGETSANVWYRIHLTMRDSQGQTQTSFRDVQPRKVTLQLVTSPAGLQVTLDGQPKTTPFSVEGVVGLKRTLGVIASQTGTGLPYKFSSWSDGGAASHVITTPAVNTTYSASFVLSFVTFSFPSSPSLPTPQLPSPQPPSFPQGPFPFPFPSFFPVPQPQPQPFPFPSFFPFPFNSLPGTGSGN